MKYKINLGDIFRVPLKDGKFAFGKVLINTWAFFNYLSQDENLDEINSSPIAFKIWCTEFAIKDGIWRVIGNKPLQEKEKELIFFISRIVLITKFGRLLMAEMKRQSLLKNV